jgi:hypothetical protein
MLQALKEFWRFKPAYQRWVQQSRTPFTPDIARLQLSTHWLLFVYDAQMRHHSIDSNLISSGAEFESAGFTYLDNYSMFIHDLGKASYPVVLQGNDVWVPNNSYIKRSKLLSKMKKEEKERRPCRIKGELFSVPYELFITLDEQMQNGVQYERTRVEILQPFRYHYYNSVIGSYVSAEQHKIQKAFMYLGDRSYWDKLVDGGWSYKVANEYTPGNLEGVQDRNYYYYDNRIKQNNSK